MIQEKTQEEHRAEAREMIFRRVRAFENRWINKEKPVTKAALYNYALSLLNVEFYKLPDKDKEMVLSQYI